MILSNKEFFELVSNRTIQLKNIAETRLKASPSGYVGKEDLDKLIALVMYSGNDKDAKWLKSLKTMYTSGELKYIKDGSDGKSAYTANALRIKRLVAQKIIPFQLNDYVLVKEDGRRGMIADYNPDTNEYLVVLNPFQLVTLKPDELMRGQVP